MNLLHLHYFYVVAKEEGFTNASKVLRIQQPAISRMVKLLEDSLGFPLFERIGRRVKLTAQGKEVFERSRRIFEEVDGLRAAVGQMSGICQGPMAIAASEPIATNLVPAILMELLRVSPKLYPIIQSGPASVLLEKIASGDLEFGLFFHIPHLPDKLKMTVLRKIRFHLVVRKDLRSKTSVMESFIGSREIDDSGTRAFPTLEKLKMVYPGASIRISANSLTAHREMVLRGLGVSVLPDFLIAQDLDQGKIVDVFPKEKFEFNLKLVERQTAVRTLNAQIFLDHCHRS